MRRREATCSSAVAQNCAPATIATNDGTTHQRRLPDSLKRRESGIPCPLTLGIRSKRGGRSLNTPRTDLRSADRTLRPQVRSVLSNRQRLHLKNSTITVRFYRRHCAEPHEDEVGARFTGTDCPTGPRICGKLVNRCLTQATNRRGKSWGANVQYSLSECHAPVFSPPVGTSISAAVSKSRGQGIVRG